MADSAPYSFVMARHGIVGVHDKLCQFEAMAEVWGGKAPKGASLDQTMMAATANREFRELVIRTVKPDVNRTAEDQVAAWEEFCEGLPYFREPGEVIANPMETAKRGGDCDDLTVLLLAGYYCLGIEEAKAQILADDKGNGYHIRALCPIPLVGKPEGWRVVDPVWHSEMLWAKGKAKNYGDKYGQTPVQIVQSAQDPSPQASIKSMWWLIPLVAGAWFLGTLSSKPK